MAAARGARVGGSWRARGETARAAASGAGPQALLFDCDGVLVDTERDGHRVAFNQAFKQKGLPHEWGVELYGELLETGGGKERMTRFFNDYVPEQEPFKSVTDADEQQALVKELHLRKTDIFMAMVEAGEMPLRPGVARIVHEALDAGTQVAVCSTSNERAVSKIVEVLLGPDVAKVMPVFAGDMVPRKKPDPAIYQMAATELGLDPARCVVIEDSRIGMQAAKGAGMRCVVTKSSYTQSENFDVADAVVDCIGDAGDERFSLTDLAGEKTLWT